ncbi:thermonuclease family protein [Agromyces sp. NPDC058126]|uniref:thermonuclease family protein n=1 Tax=Agromyces sp. NPDC058126 TaxID=3346350 RepID=UPI0036DF04AD
MAAAALIALIGYAATQELTPESPHTAQVGETVASGPYPVVRVVDGDTIVVDVDGVEQTVRLIGIDTPETVRPNTPVECYGPEASAHTHELLDGRTVTLTADPTQDDTDRYGRWLRYVTDSQTGTDVGATLLEGGYAHEYTYDTQYVRQGEYMQLERDATATALGLWGAC